MPLLSTDPKHPLEGGSLGKQILIGTAGNAINEVEFVGSAVPGASLTGFSWQISKLIYDANANVTQVLFAKRVKDLIADNGFVHAWEATIPVKQIHLDNMMVAGTTISVDVDGTTFAQAILASTDATLAAWATSIAGKAATAQVQTLTIDAALITANIIDIDVDGVNVDATFATNSNTTLAALATAIQGEAGVVTAVVTDAGAGTDDDRVIVITSAVAGTPTLLANAVITLGATQAGVLLAETTQNSAGIDTAIVQAPLDSSGDGARNIIVTGNTAGTDFILTNLAITGGVVQPGITQKILTPNSPGVTSLTYGT